MSALQEQAENEVAIAEIDKELNARDDAADATALVLLSVYETPVVVFEKPASLDVLYVALEKEVADFKPDLSTPTTRKRISSFAYKMRRTKTAIDEAGKELNAAKRAEIGAVDEIRRSMRDRMDSLIALAEQPLTDWETAETRRKEQCQRDLADLRDAGMIFNDDTLTDLEERLAKLKAMTIDSDTFREFATEADGRRRQAIMALENGIERIKKAGAEALELEASRAELAKLRAAQIERDERDAARAEAERIEREAAAKAAREKEAAELAAKEATEAAERAADQRRQDELEAQQRMIEAAAAEARRVAEAEERARQEAAEAADRREHEIEERHATELRRIEEEAAQRERDRLADIERERIAREAEEERRQEEARAAAAAEAKRQADKKHRARVMSEVLAAIIDAVPANTGGSLLATSHEDVVSAIVEAIAAGKITRTSIQF